MSSYHLDHLQCCAHGRCAGVGQRKRRAEHRHQAVANHLVDDATMPRDGFEHEGVVVVEQLNGLVGCLHTLDSVLRASSEENIDPGLRMTIHTPVKSTRGGGQELEQVVDYVSSEPKLRSGAGR